MNRAVIMWIHLRRISMKRELYSNYYFGSNFYQPSGSKNQIYKIRQVVEFLITKLLRQGLAKLGFKNTDLG